MPDYIDRVVRGELVDSTLTFQLHSGFRCLGAIEGYIDDSASESWASLIYWPNPEHPDNKKEKEEKENKEEGASSHGDER